MKGFATSTNPGKTVCACSLARPCAISWTFTCRYPWSGKITGPFYHVSSFKVKGTNCLVSKHINAPKYCLNIDYKTMGDKSSCPVLVSTKIFSTDVISFLPSKSLLKFHRHLILKVYTNLHHC